MDNDAFDLESCLACVRRGDDSAARDLVEHLYPIVIRIIRRRLIKQLDEEDVAQEVFMKMFANLDQYTGEGPFAHWVSRIAFTTCLNKMRGKKYREHLEVRRADLSEEQNEALDNLNLPDHQIETSGSGSDRELLERLISQLKPKERMIIQLLELEERSVEEVRKLTGYTATNIRVMAFRARNKLRKNLRKLLAQEKK